MLTHQPNSVDIAKNLFVPSVDGSVPADHAAKIALIATLIEDEAYEKLSPHQACADLTEPILPTQPRRLQSIVKGFADTVFQGISEVNIVPITQQEETI